MRTNHRQSGAALLVTMLFISLVSSVAFSLGRQMISEIMLTRNISDSLAAYYAAEAGLEDGLLRYKLDRNYELKDGESGAEVNLNSDKNKYKLTMSYKTTEDVRSKLVKDQTVELEVNKNDENNGKSISVNVTPSANGWRGWEVVQFDRTGNIPLNGRWFSATANSFTIGTLQNISKIRIKAFIESNNPNASVDYKITNQQKASIDSGITTIISLGVYNQSVRKLELKIDRTTGKTVGFLDYVLYAGAGEIK